MGPRKQELQGAATDTNPKHLARKPIHGRMKDNGKQRLQAYSKKGQVLDGNSMDEDLVHELELVKSVKGIVNQGASLPVIPRSATVFNDRYNDDTHCGVTDDQSARMPKFADPVPVGSGTISNPQQTLLTVIPSQADASPSTFFPNHGLSTTELPKQDTIHSTITPSAQSNKRKRNKRNTQTFQCIRLLIRLGIVPCVTTADEQWWDRIGLYVSLFDRNVIRNADGSPVTDGFAQVRNFFALNQQNTQDTHSKHEMFCEEKETFSRTLREMRPVLAGIIKIPMFKQTVSVFETLYHVNIWKECGAIDAISNWSIIRLLFLRKPKCENVSVDDIFKNSELVASCQEQAEIGVKLLSVIFRGQLAILNETWRMDSDDFRRRASECIYSDLWKTVIAVQGNRGKFGWNRECIKAFLFNTPDTCQDSEKVLSVIGITLEQMCYAQLQLVAGTAFVPRQEEISQSTQVRKASKSSRVSEKEAQLCEDMKNTTWRRSFVWSDLEIEIRSNVNTSGNSRCRQSYDNIQMYRNRVRSCASKVMIEEIFRKRDENIPEDEALNILIDAILAYNPGDDPETIGQVKEMDARIYSHDYNEFPEDEIL